MIESIELRPARAHESESLSRLAIRSKAFWGYSAAFMQACEAELTVCSDDIESASRFVVAIRADCPIGFYALSRLDGEEFELDAMFVEPDCIGQGVGRALCADAIRFARSEGAHSMLIQADPNAVGFYQTMGARIVAERESQSIAGRFLPELRLLL